MAYDGYTLTVEQILDTISKAERWRTIRKAERALQNVNKMEEEMREEKRRLKTEAEEVDTFEGF